MEFSFYNERGLLSGSDVVCYASVGNNLWRKHWRYISPVRLWRAITPGISLKPLVCPRCFDYYCQTLKIFSVRRSLASPSKGSWSCWMFLPLPPLIQSFISLNYHTTSSGLNNPKELGACDVPSLAWNPPSVLLRCGLDTRKDCPANVWWPICFGKWGFWTLYWITLFIHLPCTLLVNPKRRFWRTVSRFGDSVHECGSSRFQHFWTGKTCGKGKKFAIPLQELPHEEKGIYHG